MSEYAPREWLPHEKPMLPGSPSTPDHVTWLRFCYAFVGILVTITGALGNALVSVNLVNLQGALGAYSTEVAWLPAAYVMASASMNLLLVKFRQQFGLKLFTEFFLVLYAVVTFGHLFVNDLSSAIAVRAAHGMVGAALSSLGLYYTMQGFKKEWRLKGLAIALGASQLALPIAFIFSTSLLEFAEWRGLYLFELGLALVSLACVMILKLPPGDRIKTFEKMDFLTFALFAPGMALLCGVLSLGRIVWWLETPWIGVATAGAIVLLTAAFYVEHNRANPLLNTRWVTSGAIARLLVAMTLIRVVLSEQSIGAVGFLRAVGLNNDQMQMLFVVVLVGTIVGIVAGAVALAPTHLPQPVIVALVLIAVGAWLDSHATNVTRPAQMYVSQFLLACGGALFLGPAVIALIGRVLPDPRNLISFAVMFSLTQNVGGLIGAAALGTFQVVREKYHSNVLVEHLSLLDPLVAARVQGGAGAVARLVQDPAARSAQGLATLSAQATREANVLAYNDVFLVIAIAAVLILVWVSAVLLVLKYRSRPPAALPPSVPAKAEP